MCIIHFYTHIFWLFTSLSSVETSSSKTRTRTDRCSAPRKRFICHLSPKRKSAVFIQFSFARRHSLTLKQKKPDACEHSQSRRLHPATRKSVAELLSAQPVEGCLPGETPRSLRFNLATSAPNQPAGPLWQKARRPCCGRKPQWRQGRLIRRPTSTTGSNTPHPPHSFVGSCQSAARPDSAREMSAWTQCFLHVKLRDKFWM